MAKNKISKGIKSVKGLSTKQIMEMDVYKLNTKGLKQVLNRLISSANKRMRRMYQSHPDAPSIRNRIDENGILQQFTSKGLKSHGDYERLMSQVRSFMDSETSTMKGYNDFRNEITETIGEFESIEQETEFWTTYNEWIDNHPTVITFKTTDELVQMFYNQMITKGKTARGTKSAMTRAINKMQQQLNEYETKNDLAKRNELKNKNAFRTKKDI